MSILLFLLFIALCIFTWFTIKEIRTTWRYYKDWKEQSDNLISLDHLQVEQQPKEFISLAAYEHWHQNRSCLIERQERKTLHFYSTYKNHRRALIFDILMTLAWWLIFCTWYTDLL